MIHAEHSVDIARPVGEVFDHSIEAIRTPMSSMYPRDTARAGTPPETALETDVQVMRGPASSVDTSTGLPLNKRLTKSRR